MFTCIDSIESVDEDKKVELDLLFFGVDVRGALPLFVWLSKQFLKKVLEPMFPKRTGWFYYGKDCGCWQQSNGDDEKVPTRGLYKGTPLLPFCFSNSFLRDASYLFKDLSPFSFWGSSL